MPSVGCCCRRITPFFVCQALRFPSQLVKNTCLRCSVLPWCLPCPTYCLLCGIRIQRWEGLCCQFAAYEKMFLWNGVFSCFHVYEVKFRVKNSYILLWVSLLLFLKDNEL